MPWTRPFRETIGSPDRDGALDPGRVLAAEQGGRADSQKMCAGPRRDRSRLNAQALDLRCNLLAFTDIQRIEPLMTTARDQAVLFVDLLGFC